jgi:DNA primase
MNAALDFDAARQRRDDLSLDELKARSDIVDIISRYVKLARRGSHEFWCCCPFHADKTPSFKADQCSQRFKCFGCGAGGDVLDFVGAIERVELGEAIQRLRELIGDPAAPVRAAPPPLSVEEVDAEAERKAEAARCIWSETIEIPAGPGRDYLHLRRQITSWDPDRLRWHPHCPWKGAPENRAGCIVAPINNRITGLVVGVWRILPVLQGEVERRGLGAKRQHASRLFHAPGHELGLAEGVEDALAAHKLTGLPVWATLTAENMAAVVLSAWFRSVTIFTDTDQVGRWYAHTLAKRLREEEREVRILRPQVGKDANDVLLRARRAG